MRGAETRGGVSVRLTRFVLSLFFLEEGYERLPRCLALFIMVDIFVGHAGEELFEVLSLVALPALPVGLQVGVETL